MKSSRLTLEIVALASLVGCDKPTAKSQGGTEALTSQVSSQVEAVDKTANKKEEKKENKKKKKVTPDQAYEIAEKVLVDYLQNKPELFFEAIERAVQKQQQEKIRAVEENATKHQEEFWKSKIVVGNKDAKLKFAVFFDPLGSDSQKGYKEVMKPLVKDRSDVGFFMIPVSVFYGQNAEHPSSLVPATALMLATAQDAKKTLAFWEKFPGPQEEFSKTKMLKAAKEVGLDEKKLEKELNNKASQDLVIENGKLALRLGIPPQMPIVMVRFPDGHMEFMPLLVLDKMVVALDAILKGEPWLQAVGSAAMAEVKATEKTEASTKTVVEK